MREQIKVWRIRCDVPGCERQHKAEREPGLAHSIGGRRVDLCPVHEWAAREINLSGDPRGIDDCDPDQALADFGKAAEAKGFALPDWMQSDLRRWGGQ